MCTFTLPCAIVVARSTVCTFSTRAAINGWSSKSTRRNRVPVFGSAGFSVKRDLFPRVQGGSGQTGGFCNSVLKINDL